MRPLLDELDDLRAAVLAELADRVHLGEYVLHRAAADVANRLVAAPTFSVNTETTLTAGGMTIATLERLEQLDWVTRTIRIMLEATIQRQLLPY